ncbi:jg19778 [Pararge aegeria aegeria]|uniref:Jg19778 protein n=1 Tax=Pararge aegeria aegeria TaxID=348720 RepID=A0A8S4SI16_9NEOP|nr:jg19778 [Pararge aegeria aegeria]
MSDGAPGGALAIDMASLRSVGRCERFGALQRRMPPPRAPRTPRSPHLLCIYRAVQPLPGDARMATIPRTPAYTFYKIAVFAMRVTSVCCSPVCNNKCKNSTAT